MKENIENKINENIEKILKKDEVTVDELLFLENELLKIEEKEKEEESNKNKDEAMIALAKLMKTK